ncbi:hypothetical protein [Actinokineospora bangkokensis]|uniref:Uncharacterized protein n=1 Tax=Actinokineospora bangkokensis TaxID=1193682 RepID=A0A1Q9LRZ0_9PSEU|nr:hypothetical protein [Actinokineospora bangkokensis]OLR94807.1 hypothetical protein BJP25_09235 [Actinokineospora bangkokensis]
MAAEPGDAVGAEVERVRAEVARLLPGAVLESRPALPGDGRHWLSVEHRSGLECDVLLAEGAAFGKVLVGRYVFDFVLVAEVACLLAKLAAGEFRLREAGLFRGSHRLTVALGSGEQVVHGPRSAGPLEAWEARGR